MDSFGKILIWKKELDIQNRMTNVLDLEVKGCPFKFDAIRFNKSDKITVIVSSYVFYDLFTNKQLTKRWLRKLNEYPNEVKLENYGLMIKSEFDIDIKECQPFLDAAKDVWNYDDEKIRYIHFDACEAAVELSYYYHGLTDAVMELEI